MCHEYEGEISVEDALESCGIHKEDYDDQKSYETALRPLLKLYAKDNLSPITLNCTLDDKPYKISEKIRTHLENNYLDFVVEWIITEMYWIDTNN